MKWRSHKWIARRLARQFDLSQRSAELGAKLPDLDLFIGKHRETFHKPLIGLALLLYDRGLGLGYLTHIMTDRLNMPDEVVQAVKRLDAVVKKSKSK